jgi:hypothetical protein
MSIRYVLRTAAMGEAGAARSLHRMLAMGLLRISPSLEGFEPKHKTDPYGFQPSLEA